MTAQKTPAKPKTLPGGWPMVGKIEITCFGIGILFFWFLILTADNNYVWFIDNANLMIHEAGHMIFMPLGFTMHMWGGTLLQCIMPLAFVFSFWRRRHPAGAAVSGLWLGESLLNVAVYAADAKAMALPLVVGNIHDWNFMLQQLGLVGSCRSIAGLIWLVGWTIMLTAAAWYAWQWHLSKKSTASIVKQK